MVVPSAIDAFAESVREISSGISRNVVLGADSCYSAGRGGINFYYFPNLVSKIFFVISCFYEILGAASSGNIIC